MRTEVANYSPREISIGDSLLWGYFKKMKDLFDKKVAGETGLEPAAFCVTGRRYNQLNYSPAN